MKKILIRYLARLIGPSLIRLAEWMSRQAAGGANPLVNPPMPGVYVPANPLINPAVYQAALRDQLEAPPEEFQAELNACLETVRFDAVRNSAFLGTMAGVHGVNEALNRLAANLLVTGIYLERRLNRPAPPPSFRCEVDL